MFTEIPFEEWSAIVKEKFAKAGLQLPEDEEMLELAYMECCADDKSIEKFVEECEASQNKGQ